MKANSDIITIRETGDVRTVVGADGSRALQLGAGAAAEYLVLQDEPDEAERQAVWEITLAAGASLRMMFLSLGAGTLRNRIRVSLAGHRADCDLSGLYLPCDRQEIAFDIQLDHNVPDCRSTQLFKSIVDDHAVARFFGLIKVVPDAQRTEAYQANHNLLISDEARAYTKPQLEIYADDVKCSHGATIGRLNPDELFYLRSRGITLSEARLLQQMAFTGEVLDRISSPELRERMYELVEKRLRG